MTLQRYLAASPYIDFDTPEVWAEPLPVVVHALECYDTWDQVLANLPDVVLLD